MTLDYIKRILFCLPMLLLFLASCEDDETSTLSAVTDITYEATRGGAIIKFKAPTSNDLLYIKASYVNSLGNSVYNVCSIYENQIEISGLAEEKDYSVTLTAIDKQGGESPISVISVHPGTHYIHTILSNLEIKEIIGGVEVSWNNPSGAESGGKSVYVTLTYTDINEMGEEVEITRYLASSSKEVKQKVRGIKPGEHTFTCLVEDMYGNKTNVSEPVSYIVKEEITIPKYTEEDGYRTYLWNLVEDQTTLVEIWENRNAAIYDGVVDDNANTSDNSYAGTERGCYSGGWPWDTDQMDIVVDMGKFYNISGIRAWQRAHWYGWSNYAQHWSTDGSSKDYYYYEAGNIKSFKLFASDDIEDPNAWFLVEHCDIATNTNAGPLPVYETRSWWSYQDNTNKDWWMPSAASYQAGVDGHYWELATLTKPVRWFRVRFTSNWDQGNGSCSGLSEIDFDGGAVAESEIPDKYKK